MLDISGIKTKNSHFIIEMLKFGNPYVTIGFVTTELLLKAQVNPVLTLEINC